MNMDRYIIVAGLLFIALGLCFFVPVYYAFAIIPVLALMAMLIGSPRAVLLSYMAVILVYPILYENIPHPFIKQIDKFVGFALFAVLMGQLAFRSIVFENRDFFVKLSLTMLGYIVAVWLLNRGALRSFVQSFLVYFSFIPLFLIGRKYLKKEDFILFVKVGIGVLWISFVLNMGWRLGVSPVANKSLDNISGYVDFYKGIFPLCNWYAYYCSILFIFLISVLSSKKLDLSRGLKSCLLLSIPILLFELYSTYTNHAYILLGGALIPFLFITGLWKKWYVGFGVVFLVLLILVTYSTSEELQVQFNKENFIFRYEKLAYSAKVQLYDKVFVQNIDHPGEWVFGVGPGNGVGIYGKDNQSDYALRMLLEFYQRGDIRYQSEIQINSITGNTDAGYLSLWGDYGLLGTPLYLGMYMWLLFFCFRVLREKESDVVRRVIAQFLIGAITYILLLNFLIDSFVLPIWACIIWGMAALLFVPDNSVKMKAEDQMLQVDPASEGERISVLDTK